MTLKNWQRCLCCRAINAILPVETLILPKQICDLLYALSRTPVFNSGLQLYSALKTSYDFCWHITAVYKVQMQAGTFQKCWPVAYRVNPYWAAPRLLSTGGCTLPFEEAGCTPVWKISHKPMFLSSLDLSVGHLTI